MLDKLIQEARSVRKFKQEAISMDTLEEMVSVVRYSSSTRNLQALRYVLINDKKTVETIFPETRWAGYIEWSPKKEESPVAYVVVCRDRMLDIADNFLHFDMGIAVQNIILKAKEMGYGTCILGAFSKDNIQNIIELGGDYEIGVMLAIGIPDEEVKIVDMNEGDIKYYRDEKNIHCVPKRDMKELIIKKI